MFRPGGIRNWYIVVFIFEYTCTRIMKYSYSHSNIFLKVFIIHECYREYVVSGAELGGAAAAASTPFEAEIFRKYSCFQNGYSNSIVLFSALLLLYVDILEKLWGYNTIFLAPVSKRSYIPPPPSRSPVTGSAAEYD